MGQKKVDLKIYKERCKGCVICVEICPEHILEMSKEVNEKGMQFAVLIDPEKCTGCTLCAVMCPDLAIEIKCVEQWSGDSNQKSGKINKKEK